MERQRLSSVIVIVIAVAVALVIAEIGLRVAGIGFQSHFYLPDPVAGITLRPGAEGWYRGEGEAYVRINSAGQRDDREHERAKPPGVLRIAVLGDSYAEAMQVPAEHAFWSVMERQLASCAALADRRPEVLNFGVSGYGTAQEYEVLRHRVWEWSPDVVLLAFLPGNDLRNNVRELEQRDIEPYYLVRDGQLVLDDSFLRNPAFLRMLSWPWRLKNWLIGHSRVAQLVYELRVRSVAAELAKTQAPNDAGVFAPPRDARWKQAWDVSERLIEAMHDDGVAHGAAFHVAVLTSWGQVHPDPAVREREAARRGVEDYLYSDRRIEAFDREKGIPTVLLAERFRDDAERRGVCLHGFENNTPCGGHWNVEGHRLGGELIAAHLCETLPHELSLAGSSAR